MPSEALPMVKGCGGDDHGEHSVIYMGTNVIYLKLKTRKNRPHGSLLKRSCWCAQNKNTCPVCVLKDYLGTLGKFCPLFPNFTPGSVRIALRNRLKKIGIPNADEYRAHDFRRGHADDLRRAGKTLREILQAGEWKSPAFLQYLDLERMEHDVVFDAHVNESSGDEC